MRPVAIKRIDLEEALDELEDIQQEISILSQCDSPYITKYYGSYLKGTKLWIIMEFMGGGSALEIRKAVKIDEPNIATILHEVLMGLAYLHSEGKLHRDIKGLWPCLLFFLFPSSIYSHHIKSRHEIVIAFIHSFSYEE